MAELNLAARFLLELAAVAALGWWGYQATDSPVRFVLALAAPALLVVVWARLIAPKADSPLPPDVRIVVGSVLLLLASAALWTAGQPTIGLALAAAIIVNTVLLFVLRDSP
jgi:hypothetical protein